MRNLLNFLLKYNYWLLFILLEVICFVLLFRFNNYQQSVFFTSANVVAGKVYEVSGGISSYFHLKSVNEDLLDRNMALEQQITNLENRLKDYRRIKGKKWVDIPTKFEKRVSGSGVQFGGKYVKT